MMKSRSQVSTGMGRDSNNVVFRHDVMLIDCMI